MEPGELTSMWLKMGLAKLLPMAIVIGLVYLALQLLLRRLTDLTFDFGSRRLINTSRTIDDLLKMEPVHFEHLCRMLFQSQGYKVTVTKATADGGIDLIGHKDGKKMVAQCKRFSQKSVGRPIVQQIYGSAMHEHADKAFVLTTSRFTAPAREFAGGKPIRLIDKRELAIWINRYAGGNLA